MAHIAIMTEKQEPMADTIKEVIAKPKCTICAKKTYYEMTTNYPNDNENKKTLCQAHYVAANKNMTKNDSTGQLLKFCHKKGCIQYKIESGFRTKLKKVSISCAECLIKSEINDNTRAKRDTKEYDRMRAQTPEEKERKKQYAINNPEKVAANLLKSKAKKRKEDEEGVKKKCAQQQQKHRDNLSPEKKEAEKLARRLNIDTKLKSIKYSVETCQRIWNLTDDEAFTMFKSPCYYCDYISNLRLNGINRLDKKIGNITSNCVPCCKVCGLMTKTLNSNSFLKKCVHIATYNKLYDGKLYPDTYGIETSGSFSDYHKRGINIKNVEFEITDLEYDKLINSNCYLCRREPTEISKNGIDAIDNTVGYTTNNTASCCGICNIMKGKLQINDFLNKCKIISEKHFNTIDETIIVPLAYITTKKAISTPKIKLNRKAELDKRNAENAAYRSNPANFATIAAKTVENRKTKKSKQIKPTIAKVPDPVPVPPPVMVARGREADDDELLAIIVRDGTLNDTKQKPSFNGFTKK
jgi:hypothetical protein